MKRSKYALIALFALLLINGCSQSDKKIDPRDTTTPIKGEILFGIDESLQPIFEEQLDVFSELYKEAKVTPLYLPEDSLVDLFLKDSIRGVVMARKLTQTELDFLDKKQIHPKVYKVAFDAIAFITHLSNTDTLFTYEQIEKVLQGNLNTWSGLNNKRKDTVQVIFDNNHSSSFQYLKTKYLQGVTQTPKNFYALQNNKEVIDYVSNHTNAIGVIGVNWISNRDGDRAVSFLQKIKVLSIYPPDTFRESQDKPYKPYQAYIALKKYPFTREIYIHNREGRQGLVTGFSDFVSGKEGQGIFLKSGLVPTKAPIRIVKIKNK